MHCLNKYINHVDGTQSQTVLVVNTWGMAEQHVSFYPFVSQALGEMVAAAVQTQSLAK